jgi:hypothetical protein
MEDGRPAASVVPYHAAARRAGEGQQRVSRTAQVCGSGEGSASLGGSTSRASAQVPVQRVRAGMHGLRKNWMTLGHRGTVLRLLTKTAIGRAALLM